MWRWWVFNLKHKDLYYRYNQQQDPKAKRNIFANRVLRYWIPKEQALENKSFLKEARRKQHWTIIKEDGRVCSKCKQFKLRDEFAKTKNWINERTSNCKECRNKMKAEYRSRTNYKIDHEYKIKKRNLQIWEQISFNDNIREVISYKFHKWYKVKSILTGDERMISTADNHNKPNNRCVRFMKLQSQILKKTSKETDSEFF